MVQRLQGQHVVPNPFPCCCCCCLPNISTSWSNLRWMTLAVYQLSLIRTILFFVTLILWTDEKYDYGDVSYTNPNSYINAIIGISTLLSFYGYLLFYKATKPALAGYNLRSKFVCIILVLVVCGLQSSILETMGALGAIPCQPPLSADTRSQSESTRSNPWGGARGGRVGARGALPWQPVAGTRGRRSNLTVLPSQLSITTPWWWRCFSSASLPITVSDGRSSPRRAPPAPRTRPPRRRRFLEVLGRTAPP
ncbi:organic solute transporter subunit alpha-like [Gopherus flavomarginatus]|uniref:organic solute transporter subunit alpha-like n=1 Tax=Gopherus flavomarginatus TaxID=286002 RepID=UPI0021CBB5E9|nr:organic solute transporter subunit alpha-like [Gopherus flavomarginatus]